MTAVTPDIVAFLQFFSTSDGGRVSATPADFFGCIFEFKGNSYECRLLLDGIGPINPGDAVTVPIKFLRPDLLKSCLGVGNKFQLRELRPIANGLVENIFIKMVSD